MHKTFAELVRNHSLFQFGEIPSDDAVAIDCESDSIVISKKDLAAVIALLPPGCHAEAYYDNELILTTNGSRIGSSSLPEDSLRKLEGELVACRGGKKQDPITMEFNH